jgi:small subunit ribosomal protein S17
MTNVPGIHGRRKARDGVVVSDKMEKTIVVAVHSAIRHRLYKKTIRRSKKYMAHDEEEKAKMGDVVRIAEAAPTSKRKRWALVQVLSRGEITELAPEAIDATLVEELAAPQAPPAPKAAAATTPAAEPVADSIEVVQADAGLEALEDESMSEADVELGEPEVPPMEEEEVVQADAPSEALEQVDPAKGETE